MEFKNVEAESLMMEEVVAAVATGRMGLFTATMFVT